MGRKGVEDELEVLTVCGVGMGTSLILRMTAEDAFKQLGLRAHVTATDVSSARGMRADILIGQQMHMVEFEDRPGGPVVISVANFLDKEEMKRKIVAAMEAAGWMAA